MDTHLATFVLEHYGIRLSPRHLAQVRQAVSTRTRAMNLAAEQQYLDRLTRSSRESEVFRSLLLIHATWFFREPVTLYTLKRLILPTLLCDGDRPEFRAWCVGCATGEEVYSLAMMVHDLIRRWKLDTPVRLFGTDLDPSVLDTARRGRYPRGQCDNLPLKYLDRYCEVGDDTIQVTDQIKQLAVFNVHDVLRDTGPPPDSVYADFDLILCRNLLLYYDTEARETILRHLLQRLAPGGGLVLGLSDPLPGTLPPSMMEWPPGNRIYVSNTHWRGTL